MNKKCEVQIRNIDAALSVTLNRSFNINSFAIAMILLMNSWIFNDYYLYIFTG